MNRCVNNWVVVILAVVGVSVVMAETIVPEDYDNSALIRFAGYYEAETLTNFPVLLSWEEGKSLVSLSDFESDDYSDLRFTTFDGSNTVPYEVETWFNPDPVAAFPTNISGCMLWLRADMGVETNAAGGVTNWLDQSGSGNDAVSMATNIHPPLVANIINGKPAVRFSGTDDDYVKFPKLTAIRTVIWVISEDADASNGRFLLGDQGGNSYHFHRSFGKEIWNGQHAPLAFNGITELNGVEIDGRTTLMPTNMAALSVRTSANATANSLSRDRGISGRNWDGDVAELIIYDRVITGAEMNTVYAYLNDKYGLGITYNPGFATVWVQVPELNTNTELYVYWGNTNATAIPEYTTNGSTWASEYAGVWHFDSTDIDGSTATAHPGVSSGTADKKCIVGIGRNFNDGDQVSIPNHADFHGYDTTMSLWFKGSCSGGGREGAMLIDRRTSAGIVTVLDDNPAGSIFVQGQSGNLVPNGNNTGVSGLNDGEWHYLTVLYPTNIGTGYIYVDGVQQGTVTVAKAWNWPAAAIELGKSHDGYWKRFIGDMDEFRVVEGFRSANWIKASYDSQRHPGYFTRLEQDAYWDTETTAGLQAGNGEWNTTTNLWSEDASGSNPLHKWINGKVAYFTASNTASSITVGSVAAQGIVVDGAGYILSGGTINLGGSGMVVSEDISVGSRVNADTLQFWMVTAGKTLTQSGVVSGSDMLTKCGDGILTFSAANTLSGGLTVNGGVVNFSSPNYNFTLPADTMITINSGTVNLVNINIASDNDFTIGTNGTLNAAGHHEHVTDLIMSGGELTSTGTGKYANEDILLDGNLTVNGGTQSVIRVSNGFGLGGGVRMFDIGDANGSDAADLLITSIIRNSGTLTKTGSGTLKLTGDNVYSGGTTISNGTLLVSNTSGSGTGSGGVTVMTAGILGGTGSIAAGVVVTNGGVIGSSAAVGNLTVSTGDVVFVTGGDTNRFAVNLNSGAEYNLITLEGGSITLSNVVLDISLGYSPDFLEKYYIIVNDGSDPVVGTFAGLPVDGSVMDLGVYNGTPYEGLISYSGDYVAGSITGGNDVVIYYESQGLLLMVR